MRLALDAARGGTSATALVAAGVDRREIDRALAAGDLVRIRRNSVVDGALWRGAAPWERHHLRGRAIAAGLTKGADCPVVLTHQSALAVHEIALHGVDDRVHLAWRDGRRGRTSDVVRVHRRLDERFIVEAGGVLVASPAAACVQVAALFGAEAGLVAADDALHRRVVSADDLASAVDRLGVSRVSRGPRDMLVLADSRIESAAESRARWAFHLAGLEQPTPQVVLRDEWGEPWARVDFMLEGLGVIIEIDGMSKYAAAHDLREEKLREDRLRELGYEVVRLTWADLGDPALVRRKVEAAIGRARRRTA